jgi:Signal transduction histidine kinase
MIREVSDVYALRAEELSAKIPAAVRAVVTFSDPNYRGLFVHDSTGGIFIKMPRGSVSPPPGRVLEITGYVDPGEFAPVIVAETLEPVGEGELPAAQPAAYNDLITGLLTSQWVEVTGFVRQVHRLERSGLYLDPPTGPGREFGPPIRGQPTVEAGLFIDLAVNGGRLSGFVSAPHGMDAEQLVGATVRVRGVCASRFNEGGQFRAPWLAIPSRAELEIVEAPDAVPEVKVGDLLRYRSEAAPGTRVRLRGIVTARAASEQLFVEDRGIGLQVRTTSNVTVRRGDEVEVTGFPALGQFRPMLEDATFRRTGRIGRLEPRRINADEALGGSHASSYHDASLVRMTAQLLRRVRNGDEHLLVLKTDNVIFNAYLPDAEETDRLAHLRDGSWVEVTGVCVVQKTENWNPTVVTAAKSFQLRLDSPADVVVLQAPAWWTLQRLLWAMGLLLVSISIALAWVVVLRRRVREQTEIIEEKVRHEAVTEERTRIAREFHDTVEQELAAITMQLDAAEAQMEHTPEVARSLLNGARAMSRRSFEEVRRSVWDLRSHLLERHDLPTALREAVQPLSTGEAPEIAVEVEGRIRRLPIRTETHLLRIGQEAVTNAVKHARARRIQVICRYGPGKFQLRIRDDGRSFETDTSLSVSGGHFGLLDMRERAEKLGARFSLHSELGAGTEVLVTLAEQKSEGAGANGFHEKERENFDPGR